MLTERFHTHLCVPLFVLMIGILGLGETVLACSCAPPSAPEDALEKADAVFRGVAEKSETQGVPYKSEQDGRQTLFYTYVTEVVTFRVIEVWKGQAQAWIDVGTSVQGSRCGYDFDIGEDYLVYAHVSGGTLNTGICSRTSRVDKAEELAVLGPGTTVINWDDVPER